jgi:hypothetical protein
MLRLAKTLGCGRARVGDDGARDNRVAIEGVEQRAATCGDGREGRGCQHRGSAGGDSPIYLRAKFVGSTHISMPILEMLDSGFDGSWRGMGDAGGGCGLQEC